MAVAVERKRGVGRRKLRRLGRDQRGQAMTEYVILTSVTVALAAYLYFPDNGIFQGFRNTFNKTRTIVPWVGP